MSERPFNNSEIPLAPTGQGGSGVTERQIPHSGNPNLPEGLREQPVNDFDNTRLSEAYERDLLETPTSPSALPEALPAPEQKKSKKGLAIGISAGLAGAAIVAGSIIGINAAAQGGDEAEAPAADPKTTTEVTPDPEPEKSAEELETERLLNIPKPERWDELDAMTLEQFNQQSIESRVEYALWLNRDHEIQNKAWFAESNNPRDELVITLAVGSENTGEEIEANTRSLLRGAMLRHFDYPNLDNVQLYSDLQRQKMADSVFLYAETSAAAANWRTSVGNSEVSGGDAYGYVKNGLIVADEEVIFRSANYTITDQAGVDRVAVDITVREPDGKETSGTRILIQTSTGSQWISLG